MADEPKAKRVDPYAAEMTAAHAAQAKTNATTAQLRSDAQAVVHDAAAHAAIEVIDRHLSTIDYNIRELHDLYSKGKGDTPLAREYEERVNLEARHAASLMLTYHEDVPAGSLESMNETIKGAAKSIYGSGWEKCVSYHDLKAVHDIRDHIKDAANNFSSEDEASIFQRVEEKLGEVYAESIKSMGVDREVFEAAINRITLKSAKRTSSVHVAAPEAESPPEVAMLHDSTATSKLSKTQIDTINENIKNEFGPKTSASVKTKTEYLADAKAQLEALKTASPVNVVSVYEQIAASYAGAQNHKKAAKYYLIAANQVESLLRDDINLKPNEKHFGTGKTSKLGAPDWAPDPNGKIADLHERAGDSFRESGSLARAKFQYKKAAKLASTVPQEIGATTKVAEVEQAKLHHRRAARTYFKAALLAEEGDDRAKLLTLVGSEYLNGGSLKRTSRHFYLEAIKSAQDEALKEEIRKKMRAVE